MAQVTGLANDPGTSITIRAFVSSQLRKSGVARIEQIRTRAVSKQAPLRAGMPQAWTLPAPLEFDDQDRFNVGPLGCGLSDSDVWRLLDMISITD
jgi:hypothetical protein